MSARTAVYLSQVRTTADVFAFPSVTPMGGTLLGIPVLTTRAIPTDTGDDQYIVLLDASEILVAECGVTLDASRQASLTMDSEPSNPATSTINLWQSNCRAIRIERYLNYQMARPCIAYLSDVAY